MSMGTRIQELLDDQKLTQNDLAQLLHVHVNTVNGYINDRRTPDCETASRIAAVLNTTLDYLTGNTNMRYMERLPCTIQEGILLSNYRLLDDCHRRLLVALSFSLRDNKFAAAIHTNSENNFSGVD